MAAIDYYYNDYYADAAAAAADNAAEAAADAAAGHVQLFPLELGFRPAMATADDYYKVWETRSLAHMPSAAAAAAILDKIAEQVQPIMRRYGWRVMRLSEFCVPGFLGRNFNHGVVIRIRLRQEGRDWDSIPYEQVFDAMLHELCHNAITPHNAEFGITPHNAEFGRLWDQLRKECAELGAAEKRRQKAQAAAAVKEGRQTAAVEKRQRQMAQAAAAAEKRQRVGDVVPVRANQVGGDSGMMKALTPVQAAAMAAEKRVNGAVVGLGSSSSSPITEEDMDNQQLWECSMCTLFNKPLALICEACGARKLEVISLKPRTWSCIFCTLQNDIKLDKCTSCEQQR